MHGARENRKRQKKKNRMTYLSHRIKLFQLLVQSKSKPTVLFKIASDFYEYKEYKKAYPYYRDALLLQSDNPLYICNFACCIDMLGDHEKAITCWRQVLKLGEKKFQSLNSKEVREFKNDCILRISISYYKLNKDSLAKRYLTKYFTSIDEHNLSSLFDREYLFEYCKDLNYVRNVKM
jgi:tetratricopeptide (TPR) repeat protein